MTLNDQKPAPSTRLKELLAKALIDEALRERLLGQPEAVAREFNLSLQETQAVARLDRRTIEQAVGRVREG